MKVLCATAFLFSSHCFGADPSSDRIPIQAALVKAIEAGRVRVGDPVYARVELAWKNPTCQLREGAVLKGRIVSQIARSKVNKSSEIALLFEKGQCGGLDLKPLPLTIASVLAPDPNSDTSLFGNQQSQPLSEAVGLSLGGGGSPMRSVTTAAANVLLEPPRNKRPQTVMPGQVVGLGDMKLGVGSGPEGSSVLTSEKHNLRLDTGARLVLVSSVTAPSLAPVANSADSSTSAPAVNPTVTENLDLGSETDLCAPPACSLAIGTSETETVSETSVSIPVKLLGFSGSAEREMYTLDHDVAISYLGTNKLLFTFNPHLLVPRSAAEAGLPKLHFVRAVLIDLQTMHAVRTLDWRVNDAKQYLWPMGRERVLAHVGKELRMYGPDLKVQQRIFLNAPLAFVAVAPSGGYLAVGAIRERHSEDVHRELAEAENREPEEDVEVSVLDANFHVLATVTRSSREVPPVLSDHGEIRIPTIGKNRWRIAEYTWTGQRQVLKEVESTCRPEATSLPANLLFVTGCDRLADGKWYRILRSDGKLVLKGKSPSVEQEHTANGNAGNHLFALGITELAKAIDAAAAFRCSDLKDLHVGVYSAENGKRLVGVNISDPLPTVQTFALSPDGHQLAVLDNNQIAFYIVPAEAGSH
jgi:hypothetical protein